MIKYISSVAALYRLIRDKGYQFIIDYYNGENMEVSRLDKNDENIGITEFINRVLKEPNLIIDNIYLGNGYNASNISLLQENNIKYILNVTKEIPNHFEYNSDIKYLQIGVMDWKSESIIDYFDEILRFFDSCDNGNILVHCYMGSSRSATAVLLYLIKRKHMGLEEALEYLKNKRDIVNINKKFLEEVKLYINKII
jgi:protein-tyrosine phosphatase